MPHAAVLAALHGAEHTRLAVVLGQPDPHGSFDPPHLPMRPSKEAADDLNRVPVEPSEHARIASSVAPMLYAECQYHRCAMRT